LQQPKNQTQSRPIAYPSKAKSYYFYSKLPPFFALTLTSAMSQGRDSEHAGGAVCG
jgi:hypothetical protein